MKGRIDAAGRGVAGLAAALVAFGFAGCGEDPAARVVCVDSSQSTIDVRKDYRPELMTIAEQAAEDQAELFVDACGSNATGTVKWTVKSEFETEQDLSGVLLTGWAGKEAGKLEPDFDTLLARTSEDPGTPLGKIFGVMARKCEADPGPCDVYVLTDASWWDNLLKAYDGVTAQEEKRYLDKFGPLVEGLDGATVSFVGVGLGTDMGEQRLDEARKVGEALVVAGGGEVVFWDVSLGAEDSLR